MSTLKCRGSIALAAVLVALFSSRPVAAQVGIDTGPPRDPGGVVHGLVTGVQYDVVNQAKAEQRLLYLQAKLRRDSARGNQAAVQHDARQIEKDKYRIAVDEWLIRKNSLQYICYYPVQIDAVSAAAIAQVASPSLTPNLSQALPLPERPAAAPPIAITIINAEPAGTGLAFAIDGVAYQADGGSRQDLAVAPGSSITYDGGGMAGQHQYQLVPGLYEFRSTAEGWALYKLPSTP